MKQRSKPKNAMGWSKIRRLEDGAAADRNDGEAYVSGCSTGSHTDISQSRK